MKPFVTVIVPVRNEAKCIVNTITRLSEQDYPNDRFEIIVADGCSTDATPELVRDLQGRISNLKLVHNPKCWSSAARNLGVQHGRGDLFVVVDGHCDIGDRQYLKKMANAFERSGADSLGRPQPLEIHHASPVQEAIAAARRSWFGHNPSSHIYSNREGFVRASSVAVAYRKKVFDAVGSFDETFDACEDVEFNHRLDAAGLSCYFTPDIAVQYHPRGTLKGLFFQMSRYGRGRIRLAAKHPRALSLPAVAPMMYFTGMLLIAITAIFYLPALYLFAAGLSCYSMAILLASLSTMRQPGSWRSRLWLPLVFVAIHTGFAWGTFREFIRWLSGRIRPAARSAGSSGAMSRV
jgi:succinoglycan biosynthesis protein ExoA